MALTLTYHDSYLKNIVTESRELRALDDVDGMGTFPDAWRARLGVLRAYMLTCMESAATAEDVFSLKLSQYRKEFADVLAQAKAAADQAASVPASLFSIPIERA